VRVVVAVVAGLVALVSGCGGDSGSVTYYGDVLAIVGARCAGCHAPGGLAPFSLTSYDEAKPHAAAVAAATGSGEMPPWPPADGCGDFQGSRRLAATEIATFAAWAQAGAPAGDPTRAPAQPPTAGGVTDLGAPGATLDPGAAYHPNPTVTDDYHCFLVDPGLSSDRDLIGFEIHPGTPASVHHVLLFAVPPSKVAAAQAKDSAEAGIGWTCFASSGVGSGNDVPMTIGGWVPGWVRWGFRPARASTSRRARRSSCRCTTTWPCSKMSAIGQPPTSSTRARRSRERRGSSRSPIRCSRFPREPPRP